MAHQDLAHQPVVAQGCYIDPRAALIGNVTLGPRVMVAPMAVIRSDEDNTSIVIEGGCNVQDGVMVHALGGSKVMVGKDTSLSHGCIVHGPCIIARDSFIGFRATVFRAKIGHGCAIMHGALVTDVEVPAGKTVPAGMVLDSQEAADSLENVSDALRSFMSGVRDANQKLIRKYRPD